ncbi:unnamed protein product [Phyllotreta striolata]|uniref:acylaminoacyl-peptidase n=1 Tax=Phyllotreta striolata TaxID=444603 RepID=A0A9N9XQK6_PHYSR|nr:unnamed protein product [Phyllotreta striolata]
MTTKADKFVKTYKTLSQIPALVGGYIRSNGIVNTNWTQRNLEKGKNTEFTRDFFTNNCEKVAESLPFEVSNELISRISKSEKYRAVLKDFDNKQFLEVWQGHNLKRSVDLNTLDVHGSVYADGELSSFEWSPDETKLLYVAEKKRPKSEPFYKRKGNIGAGDGNGDEPKPKGEEHLFIQDWGEQLVGKKSSIIAQYDVENDTVEILKGVPEDVFVAQPKYSPDGSHIVGVAYQVEPRKLGLIYCSNRPSTIFRLDFNGNFVGLPLKDVAVKSPIFSTNGEFVLWLQRKSGGPHACCMQLVKANAPLNENTCGTVVVDIVGSEKQIEGGKQFYGLYNTGFIRRPWASQNRLIVNTNQKYTLNSYVIDINSGSITQLESGADSMRVVDVSDDTVLAVKRNFLKPDEVILGKLPQPGNESGINWSNLTTSEIVPSLRNSRIDYIDLKAPTGEMRDFNAIYIGPKSGDNKSVPLLVCPHGGPHSAYANFLYLEETMYLTHGFAMLLVNFRGSLGSGQKSVEYLPGKIGVSDVEDCIQATDAALGRYPWLNPDKLALTGGSHGGFLVAHLSGQYPDKFKSVVSRNPVIDVASMSISSDIPDWTYAEAGKEYSQKGEVDEGLFAFLRKVSPILHAHKVKAPTLLQIGSKDLRVPSHQGIEFYYRLKANGVKTRLNLYEDNHPLGSVPNEFDNIINSMLWIEEHLNIDI